MGLVLALSIAYAALEYTDNPSGGKADADMLDDIDPDLNLLPKPKKNDMLMAAQPLPSKPKTEKLDIVEETAEQLKKLNAITEKRTLGSDDEDNIQGRVVVSFIINTDGSLSDIHLTNTAHFLLDREALRVAKLMPKWKPGIANNKPCRTLFAIPIEFKI